MAATRVGLTEEALDILAAKEAVIFSPDDDKAGERLRDQVVARLAGRTALREIHLPDVAT
jgi:hypothetical protein